MYTGNFLLQLVIAYFVCGKFDSFCASNRSMAQFVLFYCLTQRKLVEHYAIALMNSNLESRGNSTLLQKSMLVCAVLAWWNSALSICSSVFMYWCFLLSWLVIQLIAPDLVFGFYGPQPAMLSGSRLHKLQGRIGGIIKLFSLSGSDIEKNLLSIV